LAAIAALVLLVAAATFMAWLTLRQIGGQTGDVLGALEQTGEILVLLAAASLLSLNAQ
jgi:adenosylcobinamide-GDP ribazoletransferase